MFYKQDFLAKLLKNFHTDSVEIEVQNHLQTVIRSGKSEFNLIGLDAEEYPHFPQIEEENVFKIPTDLLKAMIRQTSLQCPPQKHALS